MFSVVPGGGAVNRVRLAVVVSDGRGGGQTRLEVQIMLYSSKHAMSIGACGVHPQRCWRGGERKPMFSATTVYRDRNAQMVGRVVVVQ